MKCYVGLGSNLGNRRENLEKAVHKLQAQVSGRIVASPMFENPALVPPGAPEDWSKPFLNAAIEFEWAGTAQDLLALLKRVEVEGGRTPSARWAPRVLDLDLLLFGNEVIREEKLQVPHSEIWNRAFVLSPLKHLAPSLKIPGFEKTVLQRSRELPVQYPLWMGIFNLTPDSFSDGGKLSSPAAWTAKMSESDEHHIQIFDFGAESTRPGAQTLTFKQEWERLQPVLEFVQDMKREQFFAPLVSVDTYHAKTAARALEAGADWVNDVSGLQDPDMLEVLKSSSCPYILMHSQSVPARAGDRLPGDDAVLYLRQWLERQLESLAAAGISTDRIVFDPGIGFGKSREQSLSILKRIDEFQDLPLRMMIGHSRKSFLQFFGERPASERDPETLGISLQLARKGVDILRVHEPSLHHRAFRAYQEIL